MSAVFQSHFIFIQHFHVTERESYFTSKHEEVKMLFFFFHTLTSVDPQLTLPLFVSIILVKTADMTSNLSLVTFSKEGTEHFISSCSQHILVLANTHKC